RSERCAGGDRRRAPTVLADLRQSGPERRREPHEVEQIETGEKRSDQDPGAIAVVERVERAGGRPDLGLVPINDGRDDEEGDVLDAGRAPEVLPERAAVVHAGRRGCGCGGDARGCCHGDLLLVCVTLDSWTPRILA